LLVEFEAIFIDLAIHVNGQVRQAQHGLGETHEPGSKTVSRAHSHAASQGEVAVGKGGQDRAAINFDTEPDHALCILGWPGFDAQAGGIGMGADQAQALSAAGTWPTMKAMIEEPPRTT
jgi:hypothetical protein